MELRNSKTNFGIISRVIHATYGILFFAIIAIALYEQNIPEGNFELINLHSALGVLTLAMLIVRLVWIYKVGKPEALGTKMQQFSAKFSYVLLVITMIALPLSGLLLVMAKAKDLSVFGLFIIEGFAVRNPELINIMSFIHEYLSYFTYALLAGHIIATLAHHFIIKDATITRMFGEEV
ncbi:cytochrome b [Vibrio comitans]